MSDAAKPSHKVSLLIVDDDEDLRGSLSRYFRVLGYGVHEAPNGAEALRLLDREQVQVVISDIMMPVMDGIDLLRAIKKEHPMVHVIMITGYVTMDNALACMRLGADTLVFKPIEDFTALESAVEKAVEAVRHWVRLLKQLQTMKPVS
ncbi:MAG: response regulator [Candidatus Hydrogenedens sp.]|nr:response regulator [Candidatus Hydrogenedens sp.]